jgi:hypothetical protein
VAVVPRVEPEHTAAAAHPTTKETFMDQDTFNLGIRKFLKTVGVASQREIEQAVAKAIADHTITGTEALSVTMTLRIDALKFERTFDDKIPLE